MERGERWRGEGREGGKGEREGREKVCNYNVESTLMCHFSNVAVKMEVSQP